MTERQLRLDVGALVVYASYGIGRIMSRGTLDPKGDETVVLEFASGLVVTLPLARAREALRCVSGEPELLFVQQALRGEESEEHVWSRRVRATKERVARGDAVGLAEVVRDGIHRERRLAVRGATASTSERDLYVRARALLSQEISHSRSIALEAADLWIADQVTTIAPAANGAPAGAARSKAPARANAGLVHTPRARPER